MVYVLRAAAERREEEEEKVRKVNWSLSDVRRAVGACQLLLQLAQVLRGL